MLSPICEQTTISPHICRGDTFNKVLHLSLFHYFCCCCWRWWQRWCDGRIKLNTKDFHCTELPVSPWKATQNEALEAFWKWPFSSAMIYLSLSPPPRKSPFTKGSMIKGSQAAQTLAEDPRLSGTHLTMYVWGSGMLQVQGIIPPFKHFNLFHAWALPL